MEAMDRAFQQSLCESRSILDNLDPASARIINELQKHNNRLKGELAAEKFKCRSMARDHLFELKRLREEHEKRLESSLDALNSRKDQEKAVDLKRVEEQLTKGRVNEVKFVNKEKVEELKALERRMQRKGEENVRHALEKQRREIYEEVEMARIPDEQEMHKRQSKLMKEVFDLGEENMKLEDQVRNLANENRSQIEQLRRMKQEHKAEIDHILRQNKVDAARDMARLKLAEQVLLERDTDLMDLCQRAEIAEQEREQLEAEVTVLKIVHENSPMDKPINEPKRPIAAGNVAILKKVEDLEISLRKVEEEKLNWKQDNAALRKKLVQGGDTDSKGKKELEEEVKRLRKRNADLSNLMKSMDDRVQALKQENKRVIEKQLNDNTDVEQNLRKILSRQHAKDISEYTRKIASRDRELLEVKRRLSKYEVTSDSRHEPASELDKKLRMMAMERIKMEKLMAKLYNEVADPSDIEIFYKDICNETTRLQELSDENIRLRTQIHELQKPSEVDGKEKSRKTSEHTSDLEIVRDLREETQRLQTELQEMYGAIEDRDRIAKELADSEIATSTADRRLKMLHEDLEQARLMSQEYERVREHCTELEREVTETRGEMNDKDREICQMELESKAHLAVIQEKEEEVEMFKETVSSLKNELRQTEDLVRDLHKEVELANLPPDINHIGLQTSPLVTPKMYPQSSQTSPIIKSSSSHHILPANSRLQVLPENSSLHSELLAAGSTLSDPYETEVPLVNGDGLDTDNSDISITSTKPADITGLTTSTTSLTESDQQLVNTKFLSEPHVKLFGETSTGTMEPALYIVCDDYDPQILSPNPDKEIELSLKKGDYVYIYGKQREDGYHVGRLVDGTRGLVPSNYITKLSDSAVQESSPSRKQNSLPPPINLELNRQFVDQGTDSYCLSVCWESPSLLPSNTKGYNVYINGIFDSTVPLTTETSVLLSGIPRYQYTCVTVRTVDDDNNESCDPTKQVEINLQYPRPPVNITVQKNSSSIRLVWPIIRPTSPRSDIPTITNYKIFLNKKLLILTTPTSELIRSNGMLGIELSNKDFESNNEHILSDITAPFYLTVQSCNDIHDSSHSMDVPIPVAMVTNTLPQLSDSANNSDDVTSSEISVMSSAISHTNSSSISHSQIDNGLNEVIIGGYYKALYSYDPQLQSPNTEGFDEELSFEENDIIQAVDGLDDDGFFMGEREGERGLVPKNMVEHVTDMSTTLIADMNHIGNDHHSTASSTVYLCDGEFKIVQALYDYNPFEQSRNLNPDEELTFQEGDYIYVRKVPNEDGFYEGELKGQSGLVPMTFVKSVSSTEIINNVDHKMSSSPSHSNGYSPVETC